MADYGFVRQAAYDVMILKHGIICCSNHNFVGPYLIILFLFAAYEAVHKPDEMQAT
ncbi:MAG: hypothetical protein KC444_03585 [Nitrosopumilus sp.]|nr:hypothetical protein [Nitrosopumilus sp.]